MLLALASAVFLGSESLGTGDHILLSQIRVFHFRRLLRFEGSRCPSPSHSETDGQSVSLGVKPCLGLMTRYLLLFDSYGLFFCGAPSLTRGRVCYLYMLLALASTVFLGSKSLGTCDHMLLFQI